MDFIEQRKQFEREKIIYESAKITFKGVEGYDAYNPSIPFEWKGRKYIYARIEKRSEWARSLVKLFENTGEDEWQLVPNSMSYQLEDPFITIIGNELILGGTHVRYEGGKIYSYYTYFYRGDDLEDLYYFTTGPECMKDIRLVELDDGRIGVFSRPKGEQIQRLYGSEAMIGFTIINSLDDLTSDVIANARYIPNLFDKGEWGGCNQAYALDTGLIGIAGHKSYRVGTKYNPESLCYVNVSFVFDPFNHKLVDNIKITGTRNCYPAGPAKKKYLDDCSFTAGMVMRDDENVDQYSGVADCETGRIAIDYPLKGYGRILERSYRRIK